MRNQAWPTIMKEFDVKVGGPSLVRPAHHQQLADCYKPDAYFLSNLDLAVPCVVDAVYPFKACAEMKNKDPAEVLREALGKLLVLYYPLAGRLNAAPDGRLYVQCTGEGAVFVEGRAECCIEDIASDISTPNFRTLRRLVYAIPGASTNVLRMPPLVVQVTRFKCGGFVLGVSTNHLLYDGLSTIEFLKSWAEIARGAVLSVPPFLDRSLLRARSPPKIQFPHLEYSIIDDLAAPNTILDEKVEYQYRYFSFSPGNVEKLKRVAMEDGTIPGCTTFQVISSQVWRCRVKALGIPADQRVKLLFVMDVRRRVEPPLPKGYFGNAIYSAYSICTAGELLEHGLSFGVGLIQKAMQRMTDTYLTSAIDYLEVTREELPVKNSTEITTWSGIPFGSIDFGWGQPLQNGPATPPPHKDFVTLVSHGNSKSIDVLVGLPPRAMMIFETSIRI